MLYLDPFQIMDIAHRDDLLREAETERLIAQLPSAHRTFRADLARGLHALADWLSDGIPVNGGAPRAIRY